MARVSDPEFDVFFLFQFQGVSVHVLEAYYAVLPQIFRRRTLRAIGLLKAKLIGRSLTTLEASFFPVFALNLSYLNSCSLFLYLERLVVVVVVVV